MFCLGILLNIAVFVIFSVGLEKFFTNNYEQHMVRMIFLSGWLFFFTFALLFFLMSSFMDPGFLKKGDTPFIDIIDKAF